MAYNVGDQTRLEARFFDSSNQLSDPTTITLKVKTPGGVTTTYTFGGGTINRDATGIYFKIIDLTEAGIWNYQWSSTGFVGVEEGIVLVRSNVIP